MHTFQSLCVFLFVVNAMAAPFNQTETPGLEAHDKILTCKTAGGDIRISQTKAEGNIRAAPPVGDKATKSGFPHEFKHVDGGIKWPNKKCNEKGVKLLEIPVFADGHLFAFNEERKHDEKSKVGRARGVYTHPGKHFCGVMVNTEKDHKDAGKDDKDDKDNKDTEKDNKGKFALCK